MRGLIITFTAVAGIALSGCSQVSGWLKGGKNATTQQAETDLRTTPTQSYAFSSGAYDVELYDSTVTQTNYSGYEVVLYTNPSSQMSSYVVTDPRDAEFVKLNGTSENSDWRNCEAQSNGYLYISEYDFSLQPDFEVCMRNKGYVLTTEAGAYAVNPISAKTAGLRGYSQPSFSPSSYGYP